MDYAALTPLVAAIDLDTPGLSSAEVAARLNAPTEIEIYERFVTARTLLAELGPVQAEAILSALEAAAQQNALLARVLEWLTDPSKGGLDVGHSHTRSVIDSLVAASVLTGAQAAAVKAMAERTVSLAAKAGLPPIDPAHVQSARAMQ